MFKNNKYSNWYFNIIKYYKNINKLDCYTENHHIIPKSLGGSDDSYNIVTVPARVHFILHHLLTKMCNSEYNRRKMLHALSYFRTSKHNKRTLTARQYAICKKAHIEACIGKKLSKEHKQKISESLKNRPSMSHTEETKDKLKKAWIKRKTVPISKQTLLRKSEAIKGHKNPKSKKVFVIWKNTEICFPCLKYFSDYSEINYSTVKKILRLSKYNETFDCYITYIKD